MVHAASQAPERPRHIEIDTAEILSGAQKRDTFSGKQSSQHDKNSSCLSFIWPYGQHAGGREFQYHGHQIVP